MKITALIADDEHPQGRPECYTAETYNATAEQWREQIERIVRRFNATLRAGELPRRLLSLHAEEIDADDAFNMGLGAYHKGQGLDDNYWPAEHARHQDWRDGWMQADDDNADEAETDEEEE